MEKSGSDKLNNVLVEYQEFSIEEVKAFLNVKKKNFSVLLSNKTKNLAAGTTVRSANVFGAKHILFYGRKEYNRVPAVGSYAVLDIQVARTMEEVENFITKQGIDIVVGLENNIDQKPILLQDYAWNKDIHYLLCIGDELGLPIEILQRCDDVLEIESFGSCPSLNLSVAAGILMHDYVNRSK